LQEVTEFLLWVPYCNLYHVTGVWNKGCFKNHCFLGCDVVYSCFRRTYLSL